MAEVAELEARIADLEAELHAREEKIKQLIVERDEANNLADRMREHTEDLVATVDQWTEAFEMQRGTDGKWAFDPQQSEFWDKHLLLQERHARLVRDWNKFIVEYNA